MTKRNKVVLAIMVLLGLGIFWYSVRNVSFAVIANDFLHMNWGWLAIACLCMVISLVLEAWVVKVLIRRQGVAFSMREAIRVPLVEQLFNGITPFASGGQPAQLFILLQSGVDGGRAASSLLMKFVVYQAMIVVNFILCLFLGFHLIADKLHTLSWLVLMGFLVHFAVILGLLMVMYWYSFTKNMSLLLLKPIKWIRKDLYKKWSLGLLHKIDSFYHEGQQLKKDWRLLLKMCLITVGQLMFYYVIPYFILLALNVEHVDLVIVMTMHVLIVMVISLFPIPGGTGGAEYSFSMIFTTFVHTNSKLILAMILWRVITYYLAMFSGMIALLLQPTQANSE
ncbi:lysylphosphatidylglycerol synthase transmembrane domain-containing protein [Ligilactobacillus saerimneri]|uniref:Phosphatidylglycerol lysyltransferase n=1 Tax=Ligilactobacillus saerimneri TaxID=228229 RepID=A0A7H9EL33_9LACO|nr:lysylphosphatidylglycerol synthase transmembrane domain-containing protein [Ligilactobacillus saerimneri]QLL78271.1 flippase-like domain-containing protein [Ligilactobacillus saerimneri]